MQEQEKMKELFSKACKFPCRLLAEIIEMEHRANEEDYEELIGIAAKRLTEALDIEKEVPVTMLADEATKMELIGALYEFDADTIAEMLIPILRAKIGDAKEGDHNVM